MPSLLNPPPHTDCVRAAIIDQPAVHRAEPELLRAAVPRLTKADFRNIVAALTSGDEEDMPFRLIADGKTWKSFLAVQPRWLVRHRHLLEQRRLLIVECARDRCTHRFTTDNPRRQYCTQQCRKRAYVDRKLATRRSIDEQAERALDRGYFDTSGADNRRVMGFDEAVHRAARQGRWYPPADLQTSEPEAEPGQAADAQVRSGLAQIQGAARALYLAAALERGTETISLARDRTPTPKSAGPGPLRRRTLADCRDLADRLDALGRKVIADAVRRERARGRTLEDIGAELGVSRTTVARTYLPQESDGDGEL